MQAPSRQQVRHTFRALAIGTLFGLLVLGVSVAVFIAGWGWTRFKLDFWPLDSSRVTPNLLASFVTVVLVTIHNEARLVQKNVEHHISLEQTLRDMLDSIIHPIEEAESNIADQVADRMTEPEE